MPPLVNLTCSRLGLRTSYVAVVLTAVRLKGTAGGGGAVERPDAGGGREARDAPHP